MRTNYRDFLLSFHEIRPGMRVKLIHPEYKFSKDKSVIVSSMPWMAYYPQYGCELVTFYAIVDGNVGEYFARHVYLDPEG